MAAVAIYAMERVVQIYGPEQGQQEVADAQRALQLCRNPADRFRDQPIEHSLVGENVFVLQQDPWLAAVAQQQQQQQQALPALVQGLWPELGMIPHSCAPNTTAPVMHKVRRGSLVKSKGVSSKMAPPLSTPHCCTTCLSCTIKQLLADTPHGQAFVTQCVTTVTTPTIL
jgi:hypothetical protein